MIKEIRYIPPEDVRSLCIERNWYTCGDNNQYTYMLGTLCDKKNLTAQDIVIIATDIKTHSETDSTIADIATVLASYAITMFYEEEITD